jgi:SAM-dependent methyltransferase
VAVDACVCPLCHGALDWASSQATCGGCGRAFRVAHGVPDLLPERSDVALKDEPVGALAGLPPRVRPLLQSARARLQPSYVYQSPARRALVARFLTSVEGEGLVVNIGSGRTSYGPRVLNLDIWPAPEVHVLAAAERLPLADASCGGVILGAALEHVRDSDRTLDEIHRVLRPGGRAFIDVPFLQGYHPSPGDYRRYTLEGLSCLMEDRGFTVEEGGVSAGPGSAMTWISAHYLALLLSGRSSRLYRVARLVCDILTNPIRFTDRWLDGHPNASLIASGVWVRARKA